MQAACGYSINMSFSREGSTGSVEHSQRGTGRGGSERPSRTKKEFLVTIRNWTLVIGMIALEGCGGGGDAPTAATGKPPAVDAKRAAADSTTAVSKSKDAGDLAGKPQSGWTTYQSADGGYSVMMPAVPEVSSEPGQVYTTHIASCERADARFKVSYFDPPPRASCAA